MSEDSYLVWMLRQVIAEEVERTAEKRTQERVQQSLSQQQSWNEAQREKLKLKEQQARHRQECLEQLGERMRNAASGVAFYGVSLFVALFLGWVAGINAPSVALCQGFLCQTRVRSPTLKELPQANCTEQSGQIVCQLPQQ